MTVDKVIFNITERDFVSGLSYIVVFCVKILDGVLFEEAFDYSRFHTKLTEIMNMRIVDTRNREKQYLNAV